MTDTSIHTSADQSAGTPTAANPDEGNERVSLIEYPSDFPIKIMGPTHEHFAHTMIELVQQFDPGFDAATIELRPSAKGNYLGLTVTVRATSREQLDGLYRALSSHPMVKVVL